MKTTKESGFHAIELVIVLVVIGVIGFVGFKVMHPSKSGTSQTTSSALQIKTAKDLDTASATVDQLDTSSDLQDITAIEKDLDTL